MFKIGVKLSKGLDTSFWNAEFRSEGGATGPRRTVAPVDRILSRMRVTSWGGSGDILGRINVMDGCL